MKCLVSNREVEKSDCAGEERHPVSFLVAVGLDQSVAQAAPQNVQFCGGGWEVLSIMARSLDGILGSISSSKVAN